MTAPRLPGRQPDVPEPPGSPGSPGRRIRPRSAWLVPVAVAVLVLLAVAGASGRRGLELDSAGPLVDQRGALLTTAATFAILNLLVVLVAGFILHRRRRRPLLPTGRLPESEPVQLSVWARRLIVLLVLLLLLSPLLLLVVLLRRGDEPGADRPPDEDPGLPGDAVPALGPAAVSLTILLAVAVLAVLALRLAPHILISRRAGSQALGPDPDLPGLAEAISAGDVALRAPASDARGAIIACYAAMERVLAEHGAAREVTDTPAELLDRAVGAGLIRSDAALRLTELFREARFSAHPMAGPERAAAAAALAELGTDLTAVHR